MSGCHKDDYEQNGRKGRTTGSSGGHDWVDLGLPSGTRWATCNVGANSPEDYGDYFAWGETTQKTTILGGHIGTVLLTTIRNLTSIQTLY